MKRTSICCVALAVAMWATGANANVLTNQGFEDADTSGGDVGGAPSWGTFNDVFSSSQSAPALEGVNVLKIFGPFEDGGGAGAVQSTAAAEGETWTASGWAQNWSGDAIGENNFAVVKLEFLDSGNNVISATESAQINSLTAQDQWMFFDTTAVAPANTTLAQIVLVHVQGDPISGGSVFFDDTSLEQVVPEPSSLVLAAIGLCGLVGVNRRRKR